MRSHVPGGANPDPIISRLAGAEHQKLEGRKLCVELIQEIRDIKGVNGVHVMACYQHESVAEVVERSGVLAGRIPWHPGRREHNS